MKPKLFSIVDFIKLESSSAIILLIMAMFALIAANSGLSDMYYGFLDTNIRVGIGSFEISKPAVLWINDGLMAIFFFLVGLEIKREVLTGELSNWKQASLPIFAAIGGMALPALVFFYFNVDSPETLKAWAIPMATDIAFALGILSLLGRRVPVALKIFLLAVAIIDDIGAIIVIAIFYTSELSVNALTLSMLGFALAATLNRIGVKVIAPYLLVGLFMWACVLKSGVHATLAGVLIAFTIPMKEGDHSFFNRIEHGLHPWVAFLVLPLFAFANAGVNLSRVTLASIMAPLPIGIIAGLLIGKQIGVVGMSWITVSLGIAKRPQGMTWIHIWGVACLTGVGFTMSLFIGSLVFDSVQMMNYVRLGVLTGSLLSGILGYSILRTISLKKSSTKPTKNKVNH
ncbi:MAG: Na+/H+ antiporter NhaA [Flavobacteriaceae bacterium]|nr:Na+/H+ antiporter NhaA [Flavobacteriaceae bacterium]